MMATETMQFKAELKQLLHLIVHSLYSHKDIFLRELISNASDAVDRIRFQGLTKPELLEDNADWKIKLTPDEANRTLTISDNGVGMSRETIVEQLGQFGVGFYASFMVADKVTVISRMAGAPANGVRWESVGAGDFTIEACTKPTRGTDVILHLREDAREFLDPNRLHGLVTKYSDFVEHPIVMDVDNDGKKIEDTLNARKAIWLRNKTDISEDEYNAFYKHLAH